MSTLQSEDTGSLLASDPGSSGSQARTVEPRLRRRIDALTPAELDRYRSVISRLLTLKDNRGYYYIADIPRLQAKHHNTLFLPWNRMVLFQFEHMLAEIDPTVSVPWWDWARPVAASSFIPNAFAAEVVAGKHNPLHSVELPAAVAAEHQLDYTSTFREPGGAIGVTPVSAEAVERALAQGSFQAFSSALEALHDQTHVYAGGQLSDVALAAYDPLYWSLQANVDRLWRMWQIRNPSALVSSSLATLSVTPFSVTFEQTLDTDALGYDYDLGGGLAALVAGATGASNDLPSVDGGFGFRGYAEAFATLIASSLSEPPLTIGIYGSWGMGKSSLLRQIAMRLKAHEGARAPTSPGRFGRWRRIPKAPSTSAADGEPRRVHVVEFNAWDYNANELVWPALVRKTMDCLEQHVPQTWWEKYGHRIKRNARREWQRQKGRILGASGVIVVLAILAGIHLNFSFVSISATLIALGGAGVLGMLSKAASSPASRWLGTLLEDADYGRQTDLMSETREDLELLGERLGSGTRMLIVIDDLDRCEPSKAVEMLQAVNLLLNFQNFVVCIGVDARILTAAIEAHYRGLLGDAGASGYEYLDKIIQIPFRIPDPTVDDLEDFLTQQVSVQVASQAAGTAEISYGNADSAEPEDAPEKVGRGGLGVVYLSDVPSPENGDGDLAEAPFGPEERQAFVEVAPYLRPNPRHIKRLINAYRLVRTLAQQASEQTVLEHRVSVIHWLAISAQWPYSAYVMTRRFERLRSVDGMNGSIPNGKLLSWVYEQSEGIIDRAVQSRLDDDPDRLRDLLAQTGADVSAADFLIIQRYTINFNPAVAELPIAAAPTTVNGAEKTREKPPGPIRVRLPALVSRSPGLTAAEAAKLLEVSERSVKRVAAELERQGLLNTHEGTLTMTPILAKPKSASKPKSKRARAT